MLNDDDDFNAALDRKTPWQRYGLPVGGAAFILVAGLSAYAVLSNRSGPAPRPHTEPHITQVQLPPPPPPPPPPKTPPPPKKAEETPKQREPTPQKTVSKPAPKAPAPPAAVQTSIAGNGPGSLGLGNGGGGDCVGSGCGSGDGTGGDNDGYYANLEQTLIRQALERDEKLRFAKYTATFAYSLDTNGHAVGVHVISFSGDDDARGEVQKLIASLSTGDTPAASIVGRQFSARIVERPRG